MTSSELIDLLKRHPKACELLSVELHDRRHPPPDSIIPWVYAKCAVATEDDIGVYDLDYDMSNAYHRRFRRWLIGACVEWCDDHNVDITQDRDAPGTFILPTGAFAYNVYPSRIHAMLAAMEKA